MKMFHGSPELFGRFDLSRAGAGTGIKYGFGVYLTESERSAVHYSNPRSLKGMKAPSHYLYTVEVPDLTPGNHLMSNPSPSEEIVARVEYSLPEDALDYVAILKNVCNIVRT